MNYELEVYESSAGERPFEEWLRCLKDLRAKAKIRVRLDRVRLGNLGKCGKVGDGVHELKIHFGPGYRVYFGMAGKTCVLLLCGGSKKTQKIDILKAKEYFIDYKNREDD